MTDEAILSALWDASSERPITPHAITSLQSLSRDEQKRAAELLKQYTDKPECPLNDIRITSVGEDIYKLVKSESVREDSDTPKGKPLPSENEGRTGDFLPAVPAELKALRQWLMWKHEVRDGIPTKVPYQVNNKKAQSNNSHTWTDFETVCRHREQFSGIGFVFTDSDPYCGIDLDACLDESENVKAWAEPIVKRLKVVAYGEISPSGNGIKFWTRAVLPQDTKHKLYIVPNADAIEVYDQGRYFTVTGRGKGTILNGQEAVDWLAHEYLTPDIQAAQTAQPPILPSATTAEIIAHIRASKQVHKFNALMDGNTTGYGSQSEADLALCALIAFWTQHPTMIDEIFRQSKLYRPKWDEPHRGDKATYGQMTIETALSGSRETYTPRNTQRRSLAAAARRNL